MHPLGALFNGEIIEEREHCLPKITTEKRRPGRIAHDQKPESQNNERQIEPIRILRSEKPKCSFSEKPKCSSRKLRICKQHVNAESSLKRTFFTKDI